MKLPNDRFRRNIMLDMSEGSKDLLKLRKKYNNTGLYCTAYRYDNPKQAEANLYGPLYLDFDSDSDEIGYEQVRADALKAMAFFSAIFGLAYEDVRIYFSGKKGIHLMIPPEVLGIEGDKELNDIFKLVAKDVHTMTDYKTVDTRIYDRVRLFRLVNSKHSDTGLYKVPMTYQQLLTASYDEMQEWASEKRKIKVRAPRFNEKANRVYKTYIDQWAKEKAQKNFNKNAGNRTLDFTPPCLKHIIKNGAEQGKRNNTAAALASFYKQRGYSEEKAMDRLTKWNESVCQPPLREQEIRITLQSIYRGEYVYGCTTLADLSVCDKENCKLGKNR